MLKPYEYNLLADEEVNIQRLMAAVENWQPVTQGLRIFKVQIIL